MAIGGPIRVFDLSTGLGDVTLTEARSLPLGADHAGLVDWGEDCAQIVAVTGAQVMQVEVDAPAASPDVSRIEISVDRPVPSGTAVLQGGKLITMAGDEVIERGDVVVTDGRITAVGPSGTVQFPESATVIDVSTKVVVPGFIDVHAHFWANGELPRPESSVSFANLAYGITSLRNPQTSPDVFAFADVIEADAVPGPRVFSTGPGLFAPGDYSSPTAAAASIQPYASSFNTHLLKWYLGGSRGERQSLIQAARDLEMMPTTEGGADTKGDLTYAIDGFSGLEHAVPIAPIHDDLVQLFARTGITYTPTLVVSFGAALPIYRLQAQKRPHEIDRASRWFPDGALYQNSSSRLLWFPPEDYNAREAAEGANAILQAGGHVALGGHGEVQGLSNHWEMELLADGGMPNHDVLRVATLYGAEALGYAADLGSVEAGKLADLVVLNRDPLADITATQDIQLVMKGGVLYEAPTLDEVWPTPRSHRLPWSLERPSEPGAAIANIEATVRRTMEEARIVGMAVAVVRDGEVVLAEGYGMANLETGTRVTTETMFQSGSLGKQFTAAGILALVEEGRIDLDASVREYLSDAPAKWQQITIRHLLTHASGIPDYTSDEFDYGTNYTEEDLVRMAARLELEFPSGARWNYSNTGYAMLGVVISRVTGAPYWNFLRERIFDPAGMETIRINTQSELVPHRAQGYLVTPDGWGHPGYVAEMTNTTADGSMLLSLDDLLAWHRVVSDRAILSPESWEQMFEPMTLNSGRTYPYSFAWFIEEAGGEAVYQHSGSWQGFLTQYTRFRDGDLSILLLANTRSLAVMGLPNQLGPIVDPDLAPAPPPSEPIANTEPEATRYVAEVLEKTAAGELVLEDFAFIRQTVFPRSKAALEAQIRGRGAPDRLELLSTEVIGDDRSLQYWAWYGERRFRVLVSLGPEGGLTALRLIPEGEE